MGEHQVLPLRRIALSSSTLPGVPLRMRQPLAGVSILPEIRTLDHYMYGQKGATKS